MKRQAELAAILASGGVVAQLVAGKAARDAMFLSTFDVHNLPVVVLVAALASLGSALLMSRAMARWTPARVVPVCLALSATLYAVEWTLLGPEPKLTAILTYIHVAVFGTALIAGFWSVVNESFDPHSAKRSVRGIAMGGTAGGALGGLAGYTLGGSVGLHATLVLLCALNLACVPAVIRVARAGTRPLAAGDKQSLGFGVFKEVPYLRQLAILVALAAGISALLDYVMSAQVAGHLTDPKELVAFFALFHMGVGLSSFAVQALFTRPSLEKLGLAGTIALLPGSILVVGGLALVLPGLGTAVGLRGTESLFASSLYRAGYELLYTPLPRAQKRPAKVLIDVAVDRIGTVLGSGVVMLVLTFAAAALAERLLVALAMVAAAVSLTLSVRLHRGYIASLASSLKRGIVRLRGADIYDAATRRTLAETTAINRQVLLQAIEQQKGIQRPDSLFPPAEPSEPPSDPRDHEGDHEGPDDMMLEARDAGFGAAPLSLRFARTMASEPSSADEPMLALSDLSSHDPERIRGRLRNRSPLPAAAIPKAIELLGRDELSRDALGALRRVAPRITGQLVDALLEQERPIVQRRRIPRVLEVTPNQRTFDGLLEGLSDREFDVRHQCAWALQRITEAEPTLAVSREHVFRAVHEEINIARENWNEGHTAARNQEELKSQIMRTVEHGVVVLSLALEREPLQLAYRALLSSDEALRGTALEYFANVLPEELREAALPFLEGLSPRKASKRAAAELRDELLRTRGS